MKKPILLLGCEGQVGYELKRTLAAPGPLVALNRSQLDLLQGDDIRRAMRSYQPAVLVNAAAYTAVDRAEDEPEMARRINADALSHMGEEARALGCTVVHFSTDYVFNGEGSRPYREEDETAPLGVYGATKLEGERRLMASGARHFIFRTAWVYGARGRNFLIAILRRAKADGRLRVVSDQTGSPTWSRMIAETVTAVVHKSGTADAGAEVAAQGTYHLTSAGSTSWYGFAVAAMSWMTKHRGWPAIEVEAISTAEYPTRAKRPAYSVLSSEKLCSRFELRLPGWEEQLEQVMTELAATPEGEELLAWPTR